MGMLLTAMSNLKLALNL